MWGRSRIGGGRALAKGAVRRPLVNHWSEPSEEKGNEVAFLGEGATRPPQGMGPVALGVLPVITRPCAECLAEVRAERRS